jgi:Uma2 family endonuclease
MGMPAEITEWTADMARALPDDGMRYEVLDGQLAVTPAPSWDHQRVVTALWRRLDEYLRPLGIAEALCAPADVEFSPRRLVQPDIFVIPRRPGEVRPREWSDVKSLLLAVEVLSPTSARRDRIAKRAIYQAEGVSDYWIVDLDARIIERWRIGDERPEILANSIVWQPHAEQPPLVVDLLPLFTESLE